MSDEQARIPVQRATDEADTTARTLELVRAIFRGLETEAGRSGPRNEEIAKQTKQASEAVFDNIEPYIQNRLRAVPVYEGLQSISILDALKSQLQSLG